MLNKTDKQNLDKASIEDLSVLQTIYRTNRSIMHAQGNDQWKGNYPEPFLAEDIEQGYLYVLRDDAGIATAVMAVLTGDDPTYQEIQGDWLNDLPYLALHRIAVDPARHRQGLASRLFQAAEKLALDHDIHNIRIDTHEKNTTMQALLARFDYTYCGMIIAGDGTERKAYQKTL